MSAGVQVALGERFDQATQYAIEVHRRDTRKATTVPYVAHLFGVCALVLENGGGEDEAIGALLHDAAEDHGGRPRLEDIEQRFGSRVATIVEGCSDSLEPEGAKKKPWLARKLLYVAHVEQAAPENEPTLLVSAADKVHNLRTIREDLIRAGGDDRVFLRFSGRKWGTLWYYRALADAFARHPGRHGHLTLELAQTIGDLSGGRNAAALLKLFETPA